MDDVPRDPAFEEFKDEGRTLSELLAETPSLGYLFTPFDPGRPESRPYESMLPDVQVQEFPFEDLDARDSAIIHTLERAEKKARQIVDEADGQARAIMEDVRAKAGGLDADLKARARADAEEILAEASAKANVILADAAAREAELAESRAALESLKEQTRAVSEELATGREENRKREEELQALKADFERERADWVAARDSDLGELRRRAEEEGRALGQAKGEDEGRKKAYEESDARLRPLPAILERIGSLYQDLWRENSPQMVELAVEAAEAVLNVRLEDGRGLAAGAFEAAVGYLQHAHEATFKVRPEDLGELEGALRRLRGNLPGLLNISFLPDPSLGPGDVLMESDAGRLDATVATRRENVISALRGAIRNGVPGELPGPPPLAGEEIELAAAGPAAAPGPAPEPATGRGPGPGDPGGTASEASPPAEPAGGAIGPPPPAAAGAPAPPPAAGLEGDPRPVPAPAVAAGEPDPGAGAADAGRQGLPPSGPADDPAAAGAAPSPGGAPEVS
ncbi:MAG: hypothetical protein LBG06_08020 [Deltaproteobacteria bacterium]|jgi:flagellar biosynthesis/type III secretory pathway protein FliH|nr:hypothetical protein [Deltaproteobacteria bacterium]